MRIAALDLGSNSFHLLVAEAGPDLTFTPVAAEKEMLYLGTAVAENAGWIPDAIIERAADIVRRFRLVADAAGAREVRAVATSAFRTAVNADVLIDRIEAESGIVVDVISGRREAELIFAAVRGAVVLDPAPAFCADLGGGSLELMVGDASGATWLQSVPLGVGRLTAQFQHDDPISKRDRRAMHREVERTLAPLMDEALASGPQMLVGSSGTFTDIAAMCAGVRLGEVPGALNQFRFTRDEFGEVASAVLAMGAAERKKVLGLDARRVPVIAAGLVVCGVLFDLTGHNAMTVSEWALREGVLLDAIVHHDPADWSEDPRAIRRASVSALARRCSFPEAHSRHVAMLALRIFDQTHGEHELGSEDRELLEYAALLHDIGEHVSADGHQRHGAYLVMNGALRGFDHEEIAMLAALVRWHRRGEAKADDDIYGELDRRALPRVRALASMLQLADGLDRGHAQVIADVDVTLGSTVTTLRVTPLPGADGELEQWGARRKREQFERQFGREVEVTLTPG
jgi:exopolyphosphatase/guanosine-5'-triphosphate,3'-diphosphate pyrophosphatase